MIMPQTKYVLGWVQALIADEIAALRKPLSELHTVYDHAADKKVSSAWAHLVLLHRTWTRKHRAALPSVSIHAAQVYRKPQTCLAFCAQLVAPDA